MEMAPQGGNDALQAPWSPDPQELPHEQAEVVSAHVDQNTFQDIHPMSQMQTTHATGFVGVSEAAFHTFGLLRTLCPRAPLIRRRFA